MSRLPSMRSLVMLEAISRQGTFRAAADELNTSPSAISHRIADLEATLGAPLFNRSGRNVELNTAGREYVREIQNALSLISTSASRFAEGAQAIPVRIALHPPFAHSWLAPRMTKLAEAFPNNRFEFIYAARPSEAFTDHVDIAIEWGNEKTCLQKDGKILLPRVVTLISSPEYAAKNCNGWTIDTLQEHSILQLSMAPAEFSQWLIQLHADPSDFETSFRFSSTALLLAAIRNGLGVGIACRNLVADDLRSGKLIAPFDHEFATGDCFYIVKMPRMRDKQLSDRIVAWFVAQAEGGLDRGLPKANAS